MPQAAAPTRAARVSPMSSKRRVAELPPQWKNSHAAKNTEKPAHPMSTMKRRRLSAILVTVAGTPAPTVISQGRGFPVWLASLVDRTATGPFQPPTVPPDLPPPTLPSPARGGGSDRVLALAAGLAHRHRDFLDLAGADDLDGLSGADLDLPKPGIQVLQALGCGPVKRDERVALHQARLVRRALRLDRHDQPPALLADPALYR